LTYFLVKELEKEEVQKEYVFSSYSECILFISTGTSSYRGKTHFKYKSQTLNFDLVKNAPKRLMLPNEPENEHMDTSGTMDKVDNVNIVYKSVRKLTDTNDEFPGRIELKEGSEGIWTAAMSTKTEMRIRSGSVKNVVILWGLDSVTKVLLLIFIRKLQ
jgi:hypothetical protein